MSLITSHREPQVRGYNDERIVLFQICTIIHHHQYYDYIDNLMQYYDYIDNLMHV
jgi:hypothetical protein